MNKKIKQYYPQIVLFVFVFILYSNSLGNRYALDDGVTFWKNDFVQKGVKGIKDILYYDSLAGLFGKDSRSLEGGRYRPLSLITFALEVEFFGKTTTDVSSKKPFLGNPVISHLINILLYAISILLLYKVLTKLFINYKAKKWYLSIPFITCLLFAAHPLHTEIVANIKGRDEILAFLFSFLAFNSILNYIDKNNKIELVNSLIFIFLGSLSKEITITFIAVIPLGIYFFRNEKISKYFIITLPLILGAAFYMIIRSLVIVDQTGIEATHLMNNPFIGTSFSEKYATIIYTLLLYIKLIIFPHPQTWDYYPYHISILSWADWRVILSLIVHLFLAIVAIYGLKKKSVYSFAILVYAATLSITSNLVFNIGAFMSERFVFISLLGFCLIIAYLLVEKLPLIYKNIKNYNICFVSILSVVLLLYSVKTISRNKVWEDNHTLFSHDVKVSANSAKSNSSWASELYKLSEDAEEAHDTISRNKYLLEAKPYFEKAIEVYPQYVESLIRLGNIHYKLYDDHKTMFKYYLIALKTSPMEKDVWSNTLGVLKHNIDDPEYEKYIWNEYMKLSPTLYYSYLELGHLYYNARPQVNDSAIYWYEKCLTKSYKDFELLHNLGVAYGNIGNFSKAKEVLLQAIDIKKDAETYKFIGIAYGMEKNNEKALEYFLKALELSPDDENIKLNILIAQSQLKTPIKH